MILAALDMDSATLIWMSHGCATGHRRCGPATQYTVVLQAKRSVYISPAGRIGTITSDTSLSPSSIWMSMIIDGERGPHPESSRPCREGK